MSFALAIVGGKKVDKIERYPFIVKLSNSCAGTVIDKRWVLTAAHCYGATSHLIAGSLYSKDILNIKSDRKGSQFVGVSGRFKHPKSKRILGEKILIDNYDFLLLSLDKDLKLEKGSKVDKIKLASHEDSTENFWPGSEFTALGWGYEKEGSFQIVNRLNEIQLPFVSYFEANKPESYDNEINPKTMFNLGYDEGGKDTCNADSGGPVVKDNKLYGVISGGRGCGRKNKYGIYAKVSEAKTWIIKTISENQKYCYLNEKLITVFFNPEMHSLNILYGNKKLDRFDKKSSSKSRFESLDGDKVKYNSKTKLISLRSKTLKFKCVLKDYRPDL